MFVKRENGGGKEREREREKERKRRRRGRGEREKERERGKEEEREREGKRKREREREEERGADCSTIISSSRLYSEELEDLRLKVKKDSRKELTNLVKENRELSKKLESATGKGASVGGASGEATTYGGSTMTVDETEEGFERVTMAPDRGMYYMWTSNYYIQCTPVHVHVPIIYNVHLYLLQSYEYSSLSLSLSLSL